jgi:DNA adenine methylase
MQALKSYPGSKNGSGIYQNIINLFPKHDIYIEPFLGSGAILKRKLAAGINIGLDAVPGIIKNYDDGHGYYFSAGDSIKFFDASATLINALHNQGTKILIYCDPPYPIETRRSKAKIYKQEFSLAHHKLFLDAISHLKCYVMISTYDNQMYKDALSTWNKIDLPTVTRKGPAVETLYFNFSPDLQKHQYDFIGVNFRDRAAKKGRVYRNLSKIISMNPDEQFLLMDLLSKKIKLGS